MQDTDSNRTTAWDSGPSTACCALTADVLLDTLNNGLTELVETVKSGGMDQLDAAEKVCPGIWVAGEDYRYRVDDYVEDHGALVARRERDGGAR